MIYFTSDLHGEWNFKGFQEYLSKAGKDDLLIILGDVGLSFEKTEENREFTEKFLATDKNIAIVDGNHENFDFLNSFPEDDWNGGKVKRLTPSIVLLQRGEIYTIEGKTFFTFGGCKSSEKWKEMGLWFDGENPSPEEISLAYKSLERYGNKVDFVLTHKYEPDMHGDDPMTLEGLKDYIDENVKFGHWYAGHWHKPIIYDELHSIVYDDPTELK